MFSFPLLDDEIYYYIWSQKFALGYPEHGPFLPWIYSFSRIWFPETPFFIRLPNFILMLLLNVYLLFFQKRYSLKSFYWRFAVSCTSRHLCSNNGFDDRHTYVYPCTFALLFYFQGFTEKWPWLYLGVSALVLQA